MSDNKTTITSADLMLAIYHGFESEPYSYSGRGMYGEQCVAVTVQPDRVLSAGLMVLAELTSDIDDDAVHDMLFAVQNLMAGALTDSMGLDTVVYWPRMEWDAQAAGDMGLEDSDEE